MDPTRKPCTGTAAAQKRREKATDKGNKQECSAAAAAAPCEFGCPYLMAPGHGIKSNTNTETEAQRFYRYKPMVQLHARCNFFLSFDAGVLVRSTSCVVCGQQCLFHALAARRARTRVTFTCLVKKKVHERVQFQSALESSNRSGQISQLPHLKSKR